MDTSKPRLWVRTQNRLRFRLSGSAGRGLVGLCTQTLRVHVLV